MPVGTNLIFDFIKQFIISSGNSLVARSTSLTSEPSNESLTHPPTNRSVPSGKALNSLSVFELFIQ